MIIYIMAFPTGTINNEEKLFPTLPNNNIAPVRPQQDDLWGKDGDAFFYNGTSKMPCPAGLVWNSALKSCSWPLPPINTKKTFGDHVDEAYAIYKKERDGGKSPAVAIQTLQTQYSGVGPQSQKMLEDRYTASNPPPPTPKPPAPKPPAPKPPAPKPPAPKPPAPKPPAPKPPAPKPPSPDVGTPPPGAIVAETLKDFSKGKGVDDSLVFPRGAGPEITNITQVAPRHFKFVLRHRGNPWSPFNTRGTKGAWYDGDRNLEWNEGKRDGKYHDKSRAEVNGLPAKISNGETWDIATTVKLDKNFVPSQSYCNIMQPVFDGSFLSLTGIRGNTVTGSLFVFPNGIGSGIKTARDISIPRGEWVSIVIRVKFARDGFYQMSINGDAFKGINLDTTKARFPYSNKWGLYCTATIDVTGKPMNDSIVEHKNIYMRKE
jgi:hypothetical protein